VKKEVIFIEYQTNYIKEDTEYVQDETKEIVLEKKRLVATRDDLDEEVYEIEGELQEYTTKTEEEVKKVVEQNEYTLEINRKKSTVEIQYQKEAKEKLSVDLLDVLTDLNTKQVEVMLKESIVDVRSEEVRGLQRELTVVTVEKKEVERSTAKLIKEQARTNAAVKEEISMIEKEEKELQALEKEKEVAIRARNNKLARREEVEDELRAKEAEALKANQLSSSITNTLRSEPVVEHDEKKVARLIAMEDKRRSALVQEKEREQAAALGKEKENYKKKMQQLSESGVKGSAGEASLSSLQNEVTKLKGQAETLSRMERVASKELKGVELEKAEARAETQKLSQAHTHTNNQLEDKRRAVEGETKRLSHVKSVASKFE